MQRKGPKLEPALSSYEAASSGSVWRAILKVRVGIREQINSPRSSDGSLAMLADGQARNGRPLVPGPAHDHCGQRGRHVLPDCAHARAERGGLVALCLLDHLDGHAWLWGSRGVVCVRKASDEALASARTSAVACARLRFFSISCSILDARRCPHKRIRSRPTVLVSAPRGGVLGLGLGADSSGHAVSVHRGNSTVGRARARRGGFRGTFERGYETPCLRDSNLAFLPY